MTVADRDSDTFSLAVIPTTLQATTLGALRPGDRVNLETDILARSIWNYLQNMPASIGALHDPTGKVAMGVHG